MTELAALCKDAGITCPAGLEDTEVRLIVSDSRKVETGCLFVAIRGFHRNGEDHIEEALRNGAVAVVTEHVPDGCDRCIPVMDARAALACLFDAWYGMPSRKMKMIGVTGTNGKTTVTCMLGAILSDAGYRVGQIGTLGAFSAGRQLPQECDNELANLTTPDPSDLYRILSVMVKDGCEYVVMEASSHSLELGKVTPIRFDTAIYTNLTQEHLDFHKTMEGYLAAKQRLFRNCKTAIINQNDPYAEQIKSVCPGQIVTCGDSGADYMAKDTDVSDFRGIAYTLVTKNGESEIHCGVPGSFMVMNSMQAVACAVELGIPEESIRRSLALFRSVPGRMESVLPDSASIKVIIDYAHTPDALEKLLRTAREMREDQPGRLTVLFGCGGDRDPSKRREMGIIASRLADFVIITSDNSRSEDPVEIIRQILRGVDREKEHIAITNRHEAIRYAVENAADGDMIVLAGKGHETYEIDRAGRHPFDERIEVRKAFANRR